ncbi:MAG: hypothetical protein IIX61_07690 [Loktanella sp.]|nr:hypothetical protein [Loktanella sp.]
MALLISTRKNGEFSTSEFREVLSCRVDPKRVEDKALIDVYLNELGLAGRGPSTHRKLHGLLASFLLQATRLEARRVKHGEPLIIGWPHSKQYWQGRSEVGYKVAEQLRDAMVHNCWINFQYEALINLYDGDSNCSGYLISDEIPALAQSIQFISSDLVPEIRLSTKRKKGVVKSPIKALSKRTKMDMAQASRRIRRIWHGWQLHPYVVGNVTMTNAQRVFTNVEMTRNGRLYGAWTNMKKEQRLKGNIDGMAVAEVDVRGMNLTLLSAMSLNPSFPCEFDDPYQCGWSDRSQVKAYINEMIGAGNYKRSDAGDLCKDAGLDRESVKALRDNFVHPAFPCLKLLKKGVTDALSLAFHESEIMLRVVEALDVPVYILHDCLICRAADARLVGDTLQDVFSSYCRENGWSVLHPAYTVEQADTELVSVMGRVT